MGIFALLFTFKLKHFVADYLLQGKYMLGKFKETGWVLPLAAHCSVHALFTFGLLFSFFVSNLPYVPASLVAIALWKYPLIDFVIHFIMDRIKASPNMLGRYSALSKTEMMELTCIPKLTDDARNARDRILKENTYFWWSLGFDQMVHGMTDLFIIWLILG